MNTAQANTTEQGQIFSRSMLTMNKEEAVKVEAMAKSMHNVSTETYMGLESIRAGIMNFVAPGYWKSFYVFGKTRDYATFSDFCDQWMHFPLEKLYRVYHDDEELKRVLDEACGEPPTLDKAMVGNTNAVKRDNSGYNITAVSDGPDRGTTADYTRRRLMRDNPGLYERVCSGELSANAAAIEAGFREPTVSIRINPQSAAKTIAGKFSNDQIRDLITRLEMTLTALEETA